MIPTDRESGAKPVKSAKHVQSLKQVRHSGAVAGCRRLVPMGSADRQLRPCIVGRVEELGGSLVRLWLEVTGKTLSLELDLASAEVEITLGILAPRLDLERGCKVDLGRFVGRRALAELDRREGRLVVVRLASEWRAEPVPVGGSFDAIIVRARHRARSYASGRPVVDVTYGVARDGRRYAVDQSVSTATDHLVGILAAVAPEWLPPPVLPDPPATDARSGAERRRRKIERWEAEQARRLALPVHELADRRCRLTITEPQSLPADARIPDCEVGKIVNTVLRVDSMRRPELPATDEHFGCQ